MRSIVIAAARTGREKRSKKAVNKKAQEEANEVKGTHMKDRSDEMKSTEQ